MSKVSEHLAKRGHSVEVFTADAGSDVEVQEVRNGVRVRRFRAFAPNEAFHFCPSIFSAVRRASPDVVHAHNYHSFPMFFAALGTDDSRLVVTPHYHGGSPDRIRDSLFTLYQPFGGWALKRADGIIAVSEWERNLLYDDFRVDATVIPNGLDVVRFSHATPESRERPYLLCVGRLEEYKGVHHIVRALRDLPQYELVIAGIGPYENEIRNAAEDTGVSERVTLLGYVDEERLPSLYAGADVHLQLSTFEAYGMTVGEALAAGTSSVVRTGSALENWLSNPGVVGLTETAPDAVADAVRTARTTTPDQTGVLDWSVVVDRLEARYKHLR